MSSGKLGEPADLAAGVDTLIYTVPAGTVAAANIRLTNRNSVGIKVRIAVGSGAGPATKDYIEYDAPVPANTPLEDTQVVMSAGEKLWVRSDTANVSARAHGFEEAA